MLYQSEFAYDNSEARRPNAYYRAEQFGLRETLKQRRSALLESAQWEGNHCARALRWRWRQIHSKHQRWRLLLSYHPGQQEHAQQPNPADSAVDGAAQENCVQGGIEFRHELPRCRAKRGFDELLCQERKKLRKHKLEKYSEYCRFWLQDSWIWWKHVCFKRETFQAYERTRNI